MGHRHGRVRFHWRDVSILRGLARNRSIVAGRCLHFRLPAPARSVAGRSDEIAGENFGRALLRKTEARAVRKTQGRAVMTSEYGLPLARRTRWRRPAASRGEHLACLTSEGN